MESIQKFIFEIVAAVVLALLSGKLLFKQIESLIIEFSKLKETIGRVLGTKSKNRQSDFDELSVLVGGTGGGPKKPDSSSYGEKLKRITHNLAKSSAEVDELLAELVEVTATRQEAIQKVESDLTKLQSREKELQERIDHLKNVPLPVAEYFAELTSSGEKRSAKRDYLLFGAGVITSTIITIILRLLGLG